MRYMRQERFMKSEKNLITAAKFAIDAVETNSLECWTRGLSRCEYPDDSKIGNLLKELRVCYWHDGTYEDRERVWVAAAKLKFALKWREEDHE